jgi:hypothetical protein
MRLVYAKSVVYFWVVCQEYSHLDFIGNRMFVIQVSDFFWVFVSVGDW